MRLFAIPAELAEMRPKAIEGFAEGVKFAECPKRWKISRGEIYKRYAAS
jgi:hypothetical protein